MELFVKNLSYDTDEAALTQAFQRFGVVQRATIIKDRETGQSRGFGFVQMGDGDAQQAITGMNGQNIDGRRVFVSESKGRPARPGGPPPRHSGGYQGAGHAPRGDRPRDGSWDDRPQHPSWRDEGPRYGARDGRPQHAPPGERPRYETREGRPRYGSRDERPAHRASDERPPRPSHARNAPPGEPRPPRPAPVERSRRPPAPAARVLPNSGFEPPPPAPDYGLGDDFDDDFDETPARPSSSVADEEVPRRRRAKHTGQQPKKRKRRGGGSSFDDGSPQRQSKGKGSRNRSRGFDDDDEDLSSYLYR